VGAEHRAGFECGKVGELFADPGGEGRVGAGTRFQAASQPTGAGGGKSSPREKEEGRGGSEEGARREGRREGRESVGGDRGERRTRTLTMPILRTENENEDRERFFIRWGERSGG
jgi:hypothetical protein